MDDMIAPQIRDNCKIALPEGLKELMSDITREVLRYQPDNIYKFIADYLSVLLVTRDNLSIAGGICADICDCGCEPELRHELEDLGLDEDEINSAKDIIVKYFEKDTVNEGILLKKLLNATNIKEELISEIVVVVRRAFVRHQAHNTTIYESSSDSGDDEVTRAAKHTLDIYRKTEPNKQNYDIMATKIQASYRAFGVRRYCVPKTEAKTRKSSLKNVTVIEPTIHRDLSNYDIPFPKTSFPVKLPFPEEDEIAITSSMSKKRIATISSTSLAGSFMRLPSQKPYSAHECEVLSDLEEVPEREHAYIDYTDENPHLSLVADEEIIDKNSGNNRRISFSDEVPEEERKWGLVVEDDSSRDDEVDQASFSDSVGQLFYVTAKQSEEEHLYEYEVSTKDHAEKRGDVNKVSF